MTKDEALKMAIEALEEAEDIIEGKTTQGGYFYKAIQACKEALEQPLTRDWKETIDERIAKDDEFKQALEQPSVAELNDEYLRDTYVQGLSQPAQEPVAWIKALEIAYIQLHKQDKSLTAHGWRTNLGLKPEPDDVPLYTHPAPSWQGLSDDEIGRLAVFDGLHHVEIPLLAKFILAIEAKLKEKNT